MLLNLHIIGKYMPEQKPVVKGAFHIEMTLKGVRILGSSVQCDEEHAYLLEFGSMERLKKEDKIRHLSFIITGAEENTAASLDLPAAWTVMFFTAPIGKRAAFEKILDVMEMLNKWDSDLNEAILDDHPIQDQLDIAVRHFSNPVALFDTAFNLIAWAGQLPENVTDPVWSTVLKEGYSSVQNFSQEYLDDTLKRMDNKYPYIYPPFAEKGENRILYTFLRRQSKTFAVLAMDELCEKYSEADLSVIYHIQKRLECSRAVWNKIGLLDSGTDTVMIRLLSGEDVKASSMKLYANARGWKSSSYFRVYAITVLPETQDSSFSEDSIRRFIKRFSEAVPGMCFFLYERLIVGLEQTKRIADTDSINKDFFKTVEGSTVCAGISMAFSGFLHLREAYLQGKAALVFTVMKGSSVVEYKNIYKRDFLTSLKSQSSDVLHYCHPAVISLLDGDPWRKELFYTLYFYIDSGCHAAKTAERVHVHRNTILYRLRCLEQMTGISLQNMSTEEMLHIKLSCLIMFCEQQQEQQ